MKEVILFGVILSVIFISGCIQDNSNDQLIGGERDEYGCLGPAGYSYNETLKVCLREWEITNVSGERDAVRIAAEYLENPEGLTVVSVDVARCPGCFVIHFDKYQEQINVTLSDWEVRSWNFDEMTFCNADEDCWETCAYGCVNGKWMKDKADCTALTFFHCKCIDNVCTKVCLEKGHYCYENSQCCSGNCTDEHCEYMCPELEYINCMPAIPDEMIEYCSGEYHEWIGKNCDIEMAY